MWSLGRHLLFRNTRALCLKLFYVAFVCEKGKFLSNRILHWLSNPSKIRVLFWLIFSRKRLLIYFFLYSESFRCVLLGYQNYLKIDKFLTSKFPGERKDKARDRQKVDCFPLLANKTPTAYSHVIPYPCQQIEKSDEFSFPPNKPTDGSDDKLKNQMPSSGGTCFALSDHVPPGEMMPQSTAVWPVFKVIAPRLATEQSHWSQFSRDTSLIPWPGELI